MLSDLKQRHTALDPTQSFIVQAPAGSGKTELLTRRFLVLLARVKQPEEVVALTFTKRAAGEMHQRIVQALQLATEAEPTLEHKKTTWRLAVAAHKKSEQAGWNLTQNSNRLRITTIDALAASLCRQLPTYTPQIAASDISHNPHALYRRAATHLLTELQTHSSLRSALETLLNYYDNNADRAVALLCEMLPKREQWLDYVCHQTDTDLRTLLQANLRELAQRAIKNLHSNWDQDTCAQLHELAVYAAENTANLTNHDPLYRIFNLDNLYDADGIEHLQLWRSICKLLLTDKLELRKKIDKKTGFPAASSCKDAGEKKHRALLKQKMLDFLNILNENPQMVQALREVYQCPPAVYDDKQWQVLSSLCVLLPRCTAHLHLIFQQSKQIDFVEVNLQALRALGEAENPTELALQLDYKIQHLLIDEFQDTAYLHYHLIEKLLAGWQINDGRSVFIVGDPMQSIYRFRQAEVGLFIQTKQFGIADIPLQSLTLSSNFRSSASHIDWVNHTCASIFPSTENHAQGAIAYSPATAVNKLDPVAIKDEQATNQSGPIYIHAFAQDQQSADLDEAQQIIDHIGQIQQHSPADNITILVRSRSHLMTICQRLRILKINFNAVDVEALARAPVCSDLLALTRALMHPADDIAWYSLLRAPWCGANLQTLLELGTQLKASADNWLSQMLLSIDCSSFISDQDDLKSICRCIQVIKQALAVKGYYPLAQWLYRTWFDLGGIAALDSSDNIVYADAYFELIETIDKNLGYLDLEQLHHELTKAYVNLAKNNESQQNTVPIQVMTIHKSKGLEFDHVFIPQLQRQPISLNNSMLRWMTQPTADGETSFILAPLTTTSAEKPDPIYNYLRDLEKDKQKLEVVRLFYVAITRAKKQLYLSCSHKIKPEHMSEQSIEKIISIHPQSLAALLSDDIRCSAKLCWQDQYDRQQTIGHAKKTMNQPRLWKIEPSWQHPQQKNSPGQQAESSQATMPKNPAPNRQTLAQQIGTIIHQHIAKLCHLPQDMWNDLINHSEKKWAAQLLCCSSNKKDLLKGSALIKEALQKMIVCPRGQWILAHPSHRHAFSEKPITIYDRDIPRQLVVDRTFISPTNSSVEKLTKPVRWIIDYKCSLMAESKLQQLTLPIDEHDLAQIHHRNDQMLNRTFPALQIECAKADHSEQSKKQLEAFIIDQIKQYRPQLHQYAKLYQQIDPAHPIRLGIYFPFYQAWASWHYAAEAQISQSIDAVEDTLIL